jgi:hypothetical protein
MNLYQCEKEIESLRAENERLRDLNQRTNLDWQADVRQYYELKEKTDTLHALLKESRKELAWGDDSPSVESLLARIDAALGERGEK